MIWADITSIIPGEAIAAFVGAVMALVAAWISGRRSGAVRAKNRALQDEVKGHEIRNEVDNRIAAERDARKRLSDDWGR